MLSGEKLLKQRRMPIIRPPDYFAEMVKSDGEPGDTHTQTHTHTRTHAHTHTIRHSIPHHHTLARPHEESEGEDAE